MSVIPYTDNQQSRAKTSSPVLDASNLGGRITLPQSEPMPRKFRGDPRSKFHNRKVAELCGEALKEAYADERSAHKAIAEDTGMSARAAENWLAGDNPMSLVAFLNAYHSNPSFKAQARKLLLMEQDCDPEFEVALQRFMQETARKMAR